MGDVCILPDFGCVQSVLLCLFYDLNRVVSKWLSPLTGAASWVSIGVCWVVNGSKKRPHKEKTDSCAHSEPRTILKSWKKSTGWRQVYLVGGFKPDWIIFHHIYGMSSETH